jgi:hypothetical protein
MQKQPLAVIAAVVGVAVFGCNNSGGSDAGTGSAECVAAGGGCIVGSGPCEGTQGPQDCNPDLTPAGAFCCLPCPSGQTPNDAGLPATGCHATR